MPEQSKIDIKYSFDNLEKIHSLRDFLMSEITINDNWEGKVIITVNIQNSAPKKRDGGEVVFLGVGLRIVDNSENSVVRGSEYWNQRIKLSRLLYHPELHQQFKEGTWFGTEASESPIPNLTADEICRGEVLFPGEIIEYRVLIEQADLSYLDVTVEGTVSERHLLHVSRPIYRLKERNKILLNQTFHAVDKTDFFTPLVSIVKEAPRLGPKASLADINKLRGFVEKGIAQIDELTAKLNEAYQLTQHKIMRDYIEKGIRNYLNSIARAFETTMEVLSTGDTGNIKQVTDEMVRKVLIETEEIKLQRENLISQFSIDTRPGLLRRITPRLRQTSY